MEFASSLPLQAQHPHLPSRATGRAREVIERYRLIPSDVSQALLRRSIGLPGGRHRRERVQPDAQAVAQLRHIYERFRGQAARVPNAPRNLPFYLALRARYPDIGWDEADQTLQLPQFAGVDPSLAALLLQDLPASELSLGPRQPPELEALPPGVADELQTLFEDAHVVSRKGEATRDFARVLARGLAGEPVHLLCPVCPDYAYEPTGNPEQPWRYTFSGIGSEPGLVAERLLEDLPRFAALFARHGVEAHFVIGQADFEVLSDATLRQVGADAATFLARMAEGGRRIEARTGGLPARTLFLSELAGGLTGWKQLHAAMRERLGAISRGEAEAARPIDWAAILEARRPLYERWIGPRADDHLAFLLSQGAEYAALGELARQLSANSLMLCCDHHAMTPFYKALHEVPVVYLRRNYA
ncbi:hypothetical protein SNE35_12310 [Paucibacter sp. R3-3]|uniref:Uncharacterized protein n=1 Tax=Roseateles agri TaxID=3098619 RepID=A0ABU5DG81_9BURK|nr:hypothetical protein [Paucibacter sp. R3-3]MDY0745296.1 hypothetical protein [Paucibacter sp. R3-3]